jgi:methionyl-tRNA formyltransferase
MGSKAIGYDCLAHLLQNPAVQVVAALSNDNARFDASKSVVALATEHQIPVLADLNALPEEIDILYSVQYHQILKQAHINKAKLALNLHMAPLPEYRGSNQFSYAIIEQKKTFGVKSSLPSILQNTFTTTPQQALETERGTSLHYRSEIAELKRIDLSWPQDKIERHIRATSMPGFAPPYCLINGKKLELAISKDA